MGNKTVAIIPARGGSKRIPRKNIKEFCGVPIIYYSIHAALESQLFDEVMVSTDDEEVAKINPKDYNSLLKILLSYITIFFQNRFKWKNSFAKFTPNNDPSHFQVSM